MAKLIPFVRRTIELTAYEEQNKEKGGGPFVSKSSATKEEG